MTNTALLKKKIAESGLKLSHIAQAVGLSRQGLYNKIYGLRPFNQYEIEKMCNVLRISSTREKEAIFFAKDVSKNAYN